MIGGELDVYLKRKTSRDDKHNRSRQSGLGTHNTYFHLEVKRERANVTILCISSLLASLETDVWPCAFGNKYLPSDGLCKIR